MNINTNLKNAREKAGLTQVQVADKAHITARNYQRIEKGVQDPKTTVSILIAQALHTTVEEIFPLHKNDTTKKNEPQ